MGMYVRPIDLSRRGRVLDLFGIPLDAVLVDVANAGNAGTATRESDGFVDADMLQPPPGTPGAPKAPRGADAAAAGGGAAAADAAGGAAATEERLPAAASTKNVAEALAASMMAMMTPLPLPDMTLGLVPAEPDAAAAKADAKKKKRRAPAPPAPLADPDVIICTSATRTSIVAETAKTLGLPYVRFNVLFAEGSISVRKCAAAVISDVSRALYESGKGVRALDLTSAASRAVRRGDDGHADGAHDHAARVGHPRRLQQHARRAHDHPQGGPGQATA